MLVPETKDPETCPFDETLHCNDEAGQDPGVTVTVQAVADNPNPYPVNANCVPLVPDEGVTVITGIMERVPETTSPPGEPTTLIVHGFLSAVAKLLTTKLPDATPVELIVQVGEERIMVLGVACNMHVVSGVRRPVAVKVTVVPGVTGPLG